jgi:O-antigen/teichoic acid export membrane protein
MAQRAQRSLEAAKKAVPEGTFAVGTGLAVTGLTTYGFFVAAARGLSSTDYAAVIGGLWPLVFVVAPGCFLPLEQEVGRALAHRRALGIGGAPVVRRAAIAALWGTGGLVVISLAFGGVLTDSLFKGNAGLVLCFAIALVTYAIQHLTRGTLSGNGRFGPYGVILGAEGCIRFAPSVVLWFAGVKNPVAYGLCLAVPPVLASMVALRGEHGLLKPGPEAPWSELSTNLAYLLTGSVLAQGLGYAPTLVATVLAAETQHDAVAAFVSGFLLARVPIILFQAVQAALLPKLARLAGAGQHQDFKNGLRKLVLIVVGVGVIGVVGGFTFGPWATELFFDKTIGRGDLAMLAAGSGMFILALTLAQALIALMGHAKATFAWGVGIAVGAVTLVTTSVADVELFLRVELSYLFASAGCAAVMAALLARQIVAGVPAESVERLFEAIEHEPLEI